MLQFVIKKKGFIWLVPYQTKHYFKHIFDIFKTVLIVFEKFI